MFGLSNSLLQVFCFAEVFSFSSTGIVLQNLTKASVPFGVCAWPMNASVLFFRCLALLMQVSCFVQLFGLTIAVLYCFVQVSSHSSVSVPFDTGLVFDPLMQVFRFVQMFALTNACVQFCRDFGLTKASIILYRCSALPMKVLFCVYIYMFSYTIASVMFCTGVQPYQFQCSLLSRYSALPVRTLRCSLHTLQQTQDPPTFAQRGPAVQMSRLRQRVFPVSTLDSSHQNPHRRQTLQMQGMQRCFSRLNPPATP